MSERSTNPVLCAKKVSIAYEEQQDGVSFSMETSSDQTIKAWFTCRLLVNVVPHLHARSADNSSRAGDGQSSSDSNSLVNSPSVQQASPVTTDHCTLSFLVTSIDISRGRNELGLLMKGEEKSFCVAMNLTFVEVEQCLRAVRRCFEVAGWPSDVWRGHNGGEQNPSAESGRRIVTLH